MASCLSGGTGRAYGFDLETIVKTSSSSLSLSPSTSSRHSNSSSPSSTLSESSNSPIAVSTRKPRTPRKRPNQTYNEAAALLSTACPSIFSITKKNNKQSKLPPNMHTHFFNEPPELLLPFPATERPMKVKPREIEFNGSWNYSPNSNSLESSEVYQDDFDAESILDEDTEEGIDSIMGTSNSIRESDDLSKEKSCFNVEFDFNYNACYGYPMGLGFGGNLEFNFGFGLKNGVRALKNVNKGNWSSQKINVMNVSPPVAIISKKSPIEKKKKVENLSGEKGLRLSLKLNYDKVLEAWSDKGSPLLENMSTPESPGSDIHTRLAAIDLFSENEAREASVTRYKEKRRTWLFSKKITCQVREVSVDPRPRCKGRFVKRSNSPNCEEI